MMCNEKIDYSPKRQRGLVSIIVPIYNAEKYIGKCIESIVGQTYTNLEIILIDDGSTDNSAKVCKDWKKKDHRIRLIEQSNKGVSAARNKGLLEASGEYIAFVDADDSFRRNSIQILIDGIKKAGSDIFISGISKPDLSEGFCKYLLSIRKVAVWGTLFKAEVLKDILFPENLSNNEDFIFFFRLGLKTNSVASTDEIVYNYNTSTPQSLSKINSVKKLNSTLMACDLLKADISPELYTDFKVYLYYMYCYVLVNTRNISNLDLDKLEKPICKLRKYIQQNYFFWLRNAPFKTKSEIFKFALLTIFPQRLINIIQRVK